MMKNIRIIPSFQIVCILLSFAFLGGMAKPVFAELPPEEEGVCATVRIRLSQKVTIARTAFRATLEIENAPENVALENVAVTLDIQNTAYESANHLFDIREPEVTDISDVSGTGTILPGTSAKAVWLMIPTRDAAPEADTKYFVGGTLSYTESGTEIEIPLFPASIIVMPDPLLVLDYFWVREVYGDDPFTEDIIEPAEPFSLGLLLSNRGKGTARHVRIQSSPPEIIENEKGLLIDFQMIGAKVNDNPTNPSFNVDLGTIGPNKTAVAQWMMTSTLQGKFQKYEAKFEHLDELASPQISLIDSVNIHELTHVVRVDLPEDDGKPDFLVNDDTENDDFLPDTLYNSDGTTSNVSVISDTMVSDQVSSGNLEVTLTGKASEGWIYIRTDDPGQEQFSLKKVVRSDGREIPMEDNAWTTRRTIRLKDQAPYRENLLHLFDFADAGDFEYTLVFEDTLENPQAPVMQFVQDRTIVEGLHFGFVIKASDPNGTIPVLSAASLPDGAVFTDLGNGNGSFEWATTKGQTGSYKITFTASDSELTSSQDATITVYSADDTDGDTMPDEWETTHFANLDRNGTGDFDEDGMSDLDEYLNGTDPTRNGVSPGDINGDGSIDLRDSIRGLKSLAGISGSKAYMNADISGDKKIGIEEVIHILQTIADMR